MPFSRHIPSVAPPIMMKTSLFTYWIILTLAAIANLVLPLSAIASDAVALDFSLSTSRAEAVVVDSAEPAVKPLEIPTTGTDIPSGRFDENKALTELPPPPALPTLTAGSWQPPAAAPAETTATLPPDAPATPPDVPAAGTPDAPPPVEVAVAPAAVAPPRDSLQFERFDSTTLPLQPADELEVESASQDTAVDLEAIFAGGPNSLVARAIGSAEGTRTPEGGRTRAYGGHKDPGNGRWNMGTFSYQHGARTPEEADQKQMERLRGQALTLQEKADQYGIQMNLEEKLNALDLANQSPRAALSRGGYVDRLKESYDMGLRGQDAILWARTRSFLDPDTNRWNAPGLGNTVERITADQERRLRAIARAMEARPEEAVAGDRPPEPATTALGSLPLAAPDTRLERRNTDAIVNFDLSALPDPPNPQGDRHSLFQGT